MKTIGPCSAGRRAPAPRIDRRHDETYRRIRAECEARELARRQRETAAAASMRPELPEIAAAEPAELAELTTVCTT